MNFLLDTNIILIYIRNEKTKMWIDKTYKPLSIENIPLISVVTMGEIRSLSIRNNWGKPKNQALEKLLNLFLIADINSEDIIQRYAEIEAFSQNKLPEKPLNNTPRNMGKNDLWIAATASVTNSKLMTTDNDFDHLDKIFIDLIKVNLVK